MSRPYTPPLQPVAEPLTPEQVKRIELNRLKAKARQRQREEATANAVPSSSTNENRKRPLTVVSADSSSPTAVKNDDKQLKRDSRLGTYFEYDLSKMVNSKGGFLVEDEDEASIALLEREKRRETERAEQNLDPPIFLDNDRNPKCQECNSVDIDQTYRRMFGCNVCHRCKNEKPEKYSLLTKTECKEDYLLTDPELRDTEVLPHMLKANPHKSTYSNMMLYVRYQVEEFAWKKWGSPEALDAEYERRTSEKKRKRNKKFEEGLRDLRRRTRETVWQRRQDAEHQHTYGPVERRGSRGEGFQKCTECDFEIEVEVF